jgi:methylisocitrate lyase
MSAPSRATFKTLCATEQVFTPCVWDCFSARAAELAGYKAIFLSGSSLAFSLSGLPDMGLHNQEELVTAAQRIADFSPLPLLVDADDGFGDTVNAYRTCRRLAKGGAMGLTLEDTTNFRGARRFVPAMQAAHNLVDGNVPHEAVSRELWLSKIKAALDATADTDCLVIARTESKLGLGFEEAIERCLLAAELGAEMTYVHAMGSLDECRRVAAALPGWKMFGDVYTVNGVPMVELDEIAKLGFNLVTMHPLEKGMNYGMLEFGRRCLEDRNTRWVDEHTMGGLSPERQREVQHMQDFGWLDAERSWKQAAKDVTARAASRPR